MAVRLINKLYLLPLLAALAFCVSSCEKEDRDYDPYSENFYHGASGVGFYIEGVKYVTDVSVTAYLGYYYEVEMNWNRQMVEGSAVVFIRASMRHDLGKPLIWKDAEGNDVSFGQFFPIWLSFPLENVVIGEETVVDNPNNGIRIKRNGNKTYPFKRLAVTYTKISTDIIKGTFTAEIEVEGLEQNPVLKLDNGVFILRNDRHTGSYQNWLNDWSRND
jgi:hypothetical protein